MGDGDIRVAETRHDTGISPFDRFSDADVRALIADYPLAWVCGGTGAAIEASLLPLVGVYDDSGRLIELIGHLMRSNPLHALLAGRPDATILFRGPAAYISPEHAGRRDWAPTWNYAQLKIAARIAFDDALTEHALALLIDAVENGRAAPWRVEELGPRYHAMLPHIIGFRARVTDLSGKFKLGQDEKPSTFAAITATLPDVETVAWMRRMNGER
ncbi:MAG: FMN-binding negative transcriptional regulator [Sphingomonas sp.]|nr:FMN-binding negative transcriptional regulator [Sphingomonas sp.]